MKTFDFTPLYRSFIGFDQLAERIDHAARSDKSAGYPPYNIEVTAEDKYCITLAVAGFSESELTISVQNNTLTVVGKKDEKETSEAAEQQAQDAQRYLYKGISERNFERNFQLSEHVKVAGANMKNGLLSIDLYREVPEALKPKTIPIEISSSAEKRLESK